MHWIAEGKSENVNLHLSQFMVLLYGIACLAKPPEADMTRGVKVPFSDSLFIGSFLLVFTTSVARGNRQVPVARGEGVENSHIDK